MSDGWTKMSVKKANGGDPDEPVMVWHKYQGALVIPRGKSTNNRFYTHWRELSEDDWIDMMECKPEQRDADHWDCVIARYRWGEVAMLGWKQVRTDMNITQWQRPPAAPEGMTL